MRTGAPPRLIAEGRPSSSRRSKAMSLQSGTRFCAFAAVVCLTYACRPARPTYDIAPVLANREEVAEALRDVQTPEDAVVVLLVHVDELGGVTDVRVAVGSGDRRLDGWAVRAGRQMRFEPAVYEGRPVPSLVQIPVTFEKAPPPGEPPAALNADSLVALMAGDHPGVRGAAHVRVHVDIEGRAFEVMHLRASSLEVRELVHDLVAVMRFRPARDRNVPVDAWIVVRFEFEGMRSRICVEPDREPLGVGALRSGTVVCYSPPLPPAGRPLR